ncbi:reverse transcriptase-like protein [Halobacillus naozhouensis]|uniref:Reverse transcriptase-like protein n=1 Tax=Halobacillus naozhouensis TaxID=554880 RepID=A0ABY8J349_9BACI|nr:reverse transcriptase-like protein [Halobacillus naozhouensis]WFT76009.1 reverse transcriptase-like protein [Halobacillus naozhouensis]
MKVRIECTYKTAKGTNAAFRSEEMNASKGIVIAEDLERTERGKNLLFIDSYENTWNLKELKEFMKEVETEPHNITIYFDGGFNLETRRSGLGCAIYYEQNGKSLRLRRNALVQELNTNNEAEYAALHLGIRELDHLHVHDLPVRLVGDSQVVINQLNGEWPCLEEELSKWADRIEGKLSQMGLQPEYELISRKKNREADKLASQALKEIEITSTIETDTMS